MRLELPVLLLAATLVGCAPADGGVGQSGSVEHPAPAVRSSAAGGDAAGPTAEPQDALEATIAKAWWNQEDAADAASITPVQRAAMDAHLREYLAGWREMQRRRRSAGPRVEQALRDGDVERALAVADDYGAAAAYLEGGQLRMKIRVLSELTPEQQELLESEHPRLLRRPWVVGQRVGGGAGPAH